MFKSSLVGFIVIIMLAILWPVQLNAQGDKNPDGQSQQDVDVPYKRTFDFTLRFGMGGFRDRRSPVGSLGGDEIALDISPRSLPVAISISSEYYTNSAEPTHSYEISSLHSVNLFYTVSLPANEKLNYFLGAGIGLLEVPRGENNPQERIKGNSYNLQAGIRYRYFERIGFYGVAKYLSADKSVNDVPMIDFSERIILLGLSYEFSL